MNLDKVVFGFFIVLALTLNVAFVVGQLEELAHHQVWVLFAAILVNLIATGLKLGDRSQLGAILLSTSLVADLQLIVAALVWKLSADSLGGTLSPEGVVSAVSLATGALVANVISVVMVVCDALMSRR